MGNHDVSDRRCTGASIKPRKSTSSNNGEASLRTSSGCSAVDAAVRTCLKPSRRCGKATAWRCREGGESVQFLCGQGHGLNMTSRPRQPVYDHEKVVPRRGGPPGPTPHPRLAPSANRRISSIRVSQLSAPSAQSQPRAPRPCPAVRGPSRATKVFGHRLRKPRPHDLEASQWS